MAKWGVYGTGDGEFNATTGVAVDGDGNIFVTDNNNHRVQKFSQVKSAGEQITELIETIESMRLPKGTTTALTAKLDASAPALARGNTASACGSIGAFVNRVNALEGKKRLTGAQATLLRDAANQIRAAAGCG